MERYESPTIEPVGGGEIPGSVVYTEQNVFYVENAVAVAEGAVYALALAALYVASVIVVIAAAGKSQEG